MRWSTGDYDSRRASERLLGPPCGCRATSRATKPSVRFDDFIERPHYHIPADGDPIPFDRAALGDPLAWFVSQLRDRLAELLAQAGYARILSDVDLDAVTEHAEDIRKAMEACVPDGYVRVPGVGLDDPLPYDGATANKRLGSEWIYRSL